MTDQQDPLVIFGARLRAARKAAGLFQSDVAKRINSTQHYISEVERGLANPPFRSCILLVEAVGATFEYQIRFDRKS